MPEQYNDNFYQQGGNGYPNPGQPYGNYNNGYQNTYSQNPQNPQPYQNQGYYTRPQQPYVSQPFPQYGAYNRGYQPAPYGAPPIMPQRHSGKSVLICLGGAFAIIIAAVMIFSISGGTVDNAEVRIPSNGRIEGTYVQKDELAAAPKIGPDIDGPQIEASDTPSVKSDSTRIATEVYDKVASSVVCITSYEEGEDYVLDAVGEGSGIIITEDGYIATNSHVVDDSKHTGVMVTLANETQYLGTVIGVDVKTDLAVIKIDAKGLTPAEFANSDEVIVGQQVYAIGNPGGSAFFNSMTKGAVSAVNRLLSSGYVKYIQTDAAINPGNSGGALINEHAQVIGMNTAKLVATEYEGMGFAIPSNTVMEIVNKLIRYGYVNDRGTLSIEGKSCTLYMSKANSIPQGMMITKINSDSPLADTDAQKNDIITAVNDVTITSSVELIDELKKYKPNDTIKLTLYRPGKGNNSDSYSFDINVRLLPDIGIDDD